MLTKVTRNSTFFIGLLALLGMTNFGIAQEVEIRLGKKNIALNEYFTIALVVKNGQMKSHSDFPEIPGFDQKGISPMSSTNIINGRVSSEYRLTMHYQARKEGTYTLKPFEVQINGVAVPHDGATITVQAVKQRQQQRYYDPFEDLFGRRNTRPKEFVEVEDDAFFAITPDKNEVYRGEGVNLQGSFYVADDNQAPMEFYDLENQAMEIRQKAKPSNCWEENFNIQFKPERVKINGKGYRKYTFWESTFFPLNNKDIVVPSVPLKMVKYKVAKQQTMFGQNHKRDFKTFYSRARTIKVKALPPHPLRDQVAVGKFRLMEDEISDSIKTGESLNYGFKIVGEGNISSIKAPEAASVPALQIYPPDEFQDISATNGRVVGKKEFRYYIIPEEPGSIDLSTVFNWVFFNPETATYDTLAPNTTLNIYGESLRDASIKSSDMGSFYDRIGMENSTLTSISSGIDYLLWTQLLIFVLAGLGVWKYFTLK